MFAVRGVSAAVAALALVPATLVPAFASGPEVTDQPGEARADTDGPVRGPVRMIGGHGMRPDIAVDSRGNVTVVWTTDWWRGEIRAARRPAGGRWTDPVTIGRGTMPQVAADDSGNVTAVWETNARNRTTGVAAVTRPARGKWSTPRRLTADRTARSYWRPEVDADAFGADDLDLAVSAGGAVAVTWSWGSYDRDVPLRIQAAYRPAGSGWAETVRVSPRDWSDDPSAAIDETGDVLVAYGKRESELQARRMVADQGWTPAFQLATTDDNGGPDSWQAVAGDASGMAVVYKRDTESYGTAYARVRPPDAASDAPDDGWQSPVRLSGENVGAWSLSACTDRAGTLTATWNGMHGRLDVVRRPLGLPWEAPTTLQPEHSSVDAAGCTVNAPGDLLVSWFRYDTGIMAALAPVGNDWTAPFRITPRPTTAGYSWATDLFRGGDVAAIWDTGPGLGPIRFRRVSP